jgi:hypothetical protein
MDGDNIEDYIPIAIWARNELRDCIRDNYQDAKSGNKSRLFKAAFIHLTISQQDFSPILD